MQNMDFTLTDEQQMFKEMFADFAAREVAPQGEHIDQSEQLPSQLLPKMAEQGFLAAFIPEELGGAGLDAVSYCLLMEEMGKADFAAALTLCIHNDLAVKPILEHGSQAQQAAYLEPMAFGEMVGAFALTEPAAGSDVAGLQTQAKHNDSGYILNGSKNWVANGGIAGLFLVFVRTEKGITAFLVERDSPGFKVGYREKTLGLRGLACHTLYFDDCHVPADNVLGEEGQGFRIAHQATDYDRLALSAICLGGAERALAEGVKFSIEHEQFGGPIAHKQTIQNFVADATVEVEALRHLVYHTAWLADEGEPFGHDASIAKLFGSQVAMRAADNMLQVHGGYGYMKDYAIERLYRDCRALEIICGTSQIQQFLIARKVYRDQGIEIRP
jgi:acyl-CoA dehydrogenase